MLTSNVLQIGPVGTDSEQTYYIEVPYRCTILDVRATAQNSDIGDADTVTVLSDSTTVGVATFGTDIAAGAMATYVADTTNGKTVFAANTTVKVVVSALDASGDRVHVAIELDPYARTT